MSVVCPFSKILTGQRDGTGFPGNDKNLSRDRRSGKNGKLQSLLVETLLYTIIGQKVDFNTLCDLSR